MLKIDATLGANRRSLTWRLMSVLVPLLMTTLGCAFLGNGATPESATPTSAAGDLLTFLVPLYTVSLAPGESVLGTNMTYVSKESDAYNVTIDGLPAAKRVGDSFAWKGIVAPGVVGEYDLRISPTFSGQNLLAGGPVKITVLNPVPVELPSSSSVAQSWQHFDKIAVERTVGLGEQIPGTTLIYAGLTDQGAQLSGTDGYPFRARGDSLIWTGRLRGNVVVRLNLRVTALNEARMSLLGTAELWIGAQ